MNSKKKAYYQFELIRRYPLRTNIFSKYEVMNRAEREGFRTLYEHLKGIDDMINFLNDYDPDLMNIPDEELMDLATETEIKRHKKLSKVR